VRDSLDLIYILGWADEESLAWVFRRGGSAGAGDVVSVDLPADPADTLGLALAADSTRTCGNACTFCFVDQLPVGLRPGLYVRDEDYRLSFAYGNYVTLTNLTDEDHERICEQRLSPLYVSVHATDDTVRRRMLGNPNAPSILVALRRLATAGTRVHTQIVICPGVNDGDVLDATLADLAGLGETVASIAVVPVGLTAHRDGLPAIEPVSAEASRAVLTILERRQRQFRRERGEAIVYGADELYLTAEWELPPYDGYDDFPQLENGVGLLRSFEADLRERARDLEGAVDRALVIDVVTGELAAPFLARALREAFPPRSDIQALVTPTRNTLLGPSVTVAGLLPGRDMALALERKTLERGLSADLFLLPGEAFNEDGVTLDGMTVDEIARAAGRTPVVATRDLVGAVLDFATGGEETP